MQTAAQIDPASIEIPVRAVDVHRSLVEGLFRPPLRPEFVHALEQTLVTGKRPYWPLASPSARYYSPQAIVALLSAEGVDGWASRVAQQLRVPQTSSTVHCWRDSATGTTTANSTSC
jgi:hypothetical protein